MTWQIVLANLLTLPKDDRITCKTCGYKFDKPYSPNGCRVKYCCDQCKEEGMNNNKLKRKQRDKELVF